MGLFNFCSLDNPLSGGLSVVIQLLGLAVLARALLSWVVRDPYNPIVRALDTITEPILQPLRQVMPRLGMMDITPLVAIIILSIVAGFVCSSGI
jgi:YggT family protein